MFQEHVRGVGGQGTTEQALGVVGIGRDNDAEPGEVGVERVVVAGMVRGGRVTDADTAPKQDRHLQSATAHVLHLGNLVHQFADGVQDEVAEHEVDHRSAAGHGGAASQSHETAFTDRRVDQPGGSVDVEQPGGGVEVSAAGPDAFAHHEDSRVAFHLDGQRLVSRLNEGQLSVTGIWLRTGGRGILGVGVDVLGGRVGVRPRAVLGEFP